MECGIIRSLTECLPIGVFAVAGISSPVVVSATFDASASIVWSAMTEIEQMREWFFESIQEFRPEVGFETQFEVDCEGTVYRHCWKINEVLPEQRIVYGWSYAGITGDSTVSWELLNEDANRTTLTLTHAANEPFPTDDPNFSSESCEAGWKYFLQDRLASYLNRDQ